MNPAPPAKSAPPTPGGASTSPVVERVPHPPRRARSRALAQVTDVGGWASELGVVQVGQPQPRSLTVMPVRM